MFFIKISTRNIIKNKIRSILTGIPVFLAFLFLLLACALGEGIKKQIIKQYKNFQSGDVSVLWENAKELSKTDPSRIFFSKFDMKKKNENYKAITRFEEYLENRKDEVKAVFKPIKSRGMIDNNEFVYYMTIYGISKDELNFLIREKNIKMWKGYPLYDYRDSVYISRKAALENDIKIGNWITIDGKTNYGLINSKSFVVTGIYENYSDFDSIYVYMQRDDALDLLECEEFYFSVARIYLKNSKQSVSFAHKLDEYLTNESTVLRAEPINETTDFYFKIAQFQKSIFIVFIIFILFLIGMGMRSTIRLRIFEQLKEFGTIRAIGFSRFQNFIIIYMEMFVICLLSFISASVAMIVILPILQFIGIYIGKGAYSYIVGGTYIYPSLNIFDFLLSFSALLIFSILIPLSPGLKCVFQKITNLLNKKLVPVSIFHIIRRFLNRRSFYENFQK